VFGHVPIRFRIAGQTVCNEFDFTRIFVIPNPLAFSDFLT